ncbi:MAG: aldo/keto reductase, partial [Bacteroidota bacterium]|nr:aldo/keto reductase [Bacteroidota bacterium]
FMESEIGYGAWAIGGDAMVGKTPIGWGPADDDLSRKAIRAALDAGITFFDTADIYGLGHSESLLGEVLEDNNEVVIATKVGNVARAEQFTVDYSKQHILQACVQSLKRLRRERIDYYQLHSARLAHLQQGECIEAMQQLQQEGKVRYWGISLNTFEPEAEADFFLQHNIGNGFQLVLNIINQWALPIIKRAAKQGYGIIARMPLQFGLLTGKFDTNTTFVASDHRSGRLTPDVIHASQTAVQPVWELCTKYDVSKTELALSYILSYEEVSTVIPGMRTPEQVQGNTQKIVQLSEEDQSLMEQLGTTTFADLMKLIKQKG